MYPANNEIGKVSSHVNRFGLVCAATRMLIGSRKRMNQMHLPLFFPPSAVEDGRCISTTIYR